MNQLQMQKADRKMEQEELTQSFVCTIFWIS